MKILCLESVDPYWNLALEETVLRHRKDDDYLLLWRNDRTVVVGRYQNTLEEIDSGYVRSHGIKVVRRITGGGCVYHDLGNLNYSLITDAQDAETLLIEHFTRPVADALRALGVPAAVSGRNDILAAGKKVSGCAQVIEGGRILHHGTLLFSAQLSDAAGALRAAPDKFQSKSTKSVRSRIGNISSCLRCPAMDVLEFRDYLAKQLGQGGRRIFLDDELKDMAQELAERKYRTWEWNYGESPAFQFQDRRRFPGGLVETGVCVEDGRITAVRFHGDFLARRDVGQIEEALRGCRYRREDLEAVLERCPVGECFGAISGEEIAQCLLEAQP